MVNRKIGQKDKKLIYETLHRKLKFEQHEPYNTRMNSWASEEYTVPVAIVVFKKPLVNHE
jgi:hypothetical protein